LLPYQGIETHLFYEQEKTTRISTAVPAGVHNKKGLFAGVAELFQNSIPRYVSSGSEVAMFRLFASCG
jgi:hypothetical protein